MNRKYNIIYQNYITNSSNATNIDLTKLDHIVNHSASHIYCKCLNYIPLSEISNIINILINKIQPNGILTLSIFDSKMCANNFLLGKIPGEFLLSAIINYKSLLCLEDIYTKIDYNTCKILQVNSTDNFIDVTIERLKIQ